MYETQTVENQNFKISGNWEEFAKRLQQKFWIDLKVKLALQPDKDEELLKV